MLKPARSYEEACRTFRWRIPDRYNLAFDLCDRQTIGGADAHRTALVVDDGNGRVDRYSFAMLKLLTNRVCTVLAAQGLGPGDRVLLSLPASVEAAILLLAAPRMGAVAVPVALATDIATLIDRINRTDARVAVLTRTAFEAVMDQRDSVPGLNAVLVTDGIGGDGDFWALLERASDSFDLALTSADDAAYLFHPHGEPTGILHAHRSVPGNLPAMELALGFFPQSGDVLWTSWDWMGFEGLLWAVMPAWHHGVPVIASPLPFDPDRALALMSDHGVRTVLMPPDHLSALTDAAFRKSHALPRAMASGPDALPKALHDAVERAFGVVPNEIWGTCRVGAVAANNASLMELRIGSPGKAVPGVFVEAADYDGTRILGAGNAGILSAAPDTPGACLGLWGETQADLRLAGGWISSGWSGSRDLDGYLWPDPRPGLIIPVPTPPAAQSAPSIRLDAPSRTERW